MREYYFRDLQAGDVEAIAARMRFEDRRELKRWTGKTPLESMQEAARLADVIKIGCWKDGTILAAFGAKRLNLLEREGCIWALSTEEANAHKLTFARASKEGMRLVMDALDDMEVFYNYVDAEYERCIKWIEWLGGSISARGAFAGRYGGRFLQFIIWPAGGARHT